MTTFERYYIADEATHVEKKNAYFQLRDDSEICRELLEEFGLGTDGLIINGHTPVREKNGESPLKAKGQLVVIDGGFAKGYQKHTGIAGYTLIANSYGLQLMAHQPFRTVEAVLKGRFDIVSATRLVESVETRVLVKDTNIGQKIAQEIKDLEYLYHHYE